MYIEDQVVAFDLDGTLFDGDCAELWIDYLNANNWPNSEQAVANCRELMANYEGGNFDIVEYTNASLAPLVGKRIDDVNDLAKQFAQSVKTRLFSPCLKALQWHQLQGHKIICISASSDFIVQAITEGLGFDHCIGIITELEQQRITGQVARPLSFQHSKTDILRDKFSPRLHYAYSDSINDLALLQMAEHSAVVNPSQQLKEIALDNNWQVLNWT